MPLAAWRENSSRHVASLRRIRLLFFIAPVSSTITGRDYPQWTDLRKYVAELPVTMEQDLGTALEWVGVAHYNTDNPHIHLLVRGKAAGGGDLVMNREYISYGLRAQAM